MNNVLPSRFEYKYRFDLKGSTHGRFASDDELSKKNSTLKDLDFAQLLPEGLKLASTDHANLLRTLQRDTAWLQQQRVMDYSLLLGIHIPQEGAPASDGVGQIGSGDSADGVGEQGGRVPLTF